MPNVVPTAAQFFAEESDVGPEDISQRVVALLDEAAVATREQHKILNLRTVQELITNRDAALLDNFLDEVLAFQNDRSPDVKKFLIGFMEIACKRDPAILPKVVANIRIMLDEENPNVQKRAIQAATQLYRVCFKWLCASKGTSDIDDLKKSTWKYFQDIKESIVGLLDSYNDGIRTLVVKFMEMVVLTQTFPDAHSPTRGEDEVSLDDASTHVAQFIKPSQLEEQAKKTLERLLAFHGTQHISSVNLMACSQSLVIIAKSRAEFMSRVINALEALHANLPPTLSKSQVSSVRKHLKLQLFLLCKHPVALGFAPQLTTLLSDLGATPHEMAKQLPPKFIEESSRKRSIPVDAPVARKIPRSSPSVVSAVADEEEDDETSKVPKMAQDPTQSAIDITASDIAPRLTTLNVTDVVLVTMLRLPETMPANFQATYTPISVAGTEQQIAHLSRLMATQMTAQNMGKGVEEMMKKAQLEMSRAEAEPMQIETIGRAKAASSSTSASHSSSSQKSKSDESSPILLPAGAEALKMRARTLNLSEVTKSMNRKEGEQFMSSAVRRLLRTGSIGHSKAKLKTIARLAMQIRGQISEVIREFIFQNVRANSDLVMVWLFEEYNADLSSEGIDSSLRNYGQCLQDILMDLLIKVETRDRDVIFQKIFMEAPVVTENAIDILQQYCQNEVSVNHGLNILRSLIEYRPIKQKHYLELLLQLTVNHMEEVRQQAVKQCLILAEKSAEMKEAVERYAVDHLRSLLQPSPPASLYPNQQDGDNVWLEDDIKLCMTLYLALLPANHSLVHELAKVYVDAPPDTKRTILWTLEQPVKGMGMESPELLRLLENCPPGAETLITRIIHLLTEQNTPSPELVARVRDLYHKRVADVRFLIPVLTGLTKKEVIAALPKLIKLNSNVVKEVFNRLLGCGENGPLSPADLLVALHNIDPTKCDVKTVIKTTSICFAEKSVYTQDVLALVLQQLMEQTPLPTLLMRTVIQSLALYPRLLGFVMNILQRLITKQVWKQKKVWEGFIKCCERAQPQSLNVIIQLPPEPLRELFEAAPSLKDPLVQHVTSLTQHQKSHVPSKVLEILFPEDVASKSKTPEKTETDEHHISG
ncbi:symplekin [Galendromus occidentalis]|uniref:Symplekin n=1 Tax=Galendromus occidentalis TaxID=34638 RepID=A0AAJ7SGV9_9ACAR|nr:symplekin [Galendromus occidentalis]